MARRAWLFADTPKGAVANAMLYTLEESAKQNKLDVYGYFNYLLITMPNVDFHNYPELLNIPAILRSIVGRMSAGKK